MIVLKLIRIIFLFGIGPQLLGMLVTRFKKEKNPVFFSFVMGYFLQFAILQLLAVPMIFLKIKFSTLFYSWGNIIGILAILSFVLNIHRFKIQDLWNTIKDNFNVQNIIAGLFILVQVIVPMIYMHVDQDDSFYVVTASTSIAENSMYIVAAEDGLEYQRLPPRYVLSPFPLYLASVSVAIGVHPTIVAHTILPPIFILLAYMIYTQIAFHLFKGEKKAVSIFLIFLSLLYIWGNFSIYTNFTFLLLRIWQGKAMLANVILPAIWLMFLECIKNDKKIGNWLILLMVMIASCHVSSMGIALAPMTLGGLAVVFSIRNRKISYILKSAICMIPNLIYGLTYLFMIR